MGLDIVELVMDLEDQFGIPIDDDAFGDIETVGQLYDHILLVMRRHPAHRIVLCASASCFYHLRRELLADPQMPPTRVRPDSRFADVVPAGQRRRVLTRLTQMLGLPTPRLRFNVTTATLEPPPGLRVRDLVASYVQRVPVRFITAGQIDEEAVWGALSRILLKYTPGDPARITREARLVKDLGLC